MTTLLNILPIIISYFFTCINLSFLLKTKRNNLIYLIGLIIHIIAFHLTNPLKTILFIITQILLFYPKTKKLKKVISAILYNIFITIEIELIFIILVTKNIELTSIITIITSIIINILSFITIRTEFFKKVWKLIQDKLEEYLFILSLIMITLTYISYCYHYKVLNITIIILIIIILITSLIKKIIELSTLEKNYDQMLKFTTTYEKIIDELRLNQHEYKNNLICIKSMVSKNQKATEYIDSILNEKTIKDSTLLRDVRKININSLVGLIYFKLCQAKEKEIQTIINVSNNLPSKKLKQIETSLSKDISKIMGILLDNAIESCLETKEKSLSMYVYEEKGILTFQISNTFKGTINIDLLYKKGYTTKGKKHGYGLVIVKEILKRNKKISLEGEIHNDVFTQYLKIDIN